MKYTRLLSLVSVVALVQSTYVVDANARSPWVLVEINSNPSLSTPPPDATETTAESGSIVWVNEPSVLPHFRFTLSWPTRKLSGSARFEPGHELELKLTGTAAIVGNQDRAGGSTLDGLLLVNGVWIQSQLGPHARAACDQPNVCTDEATSVSVMRIEFPAGGDEFRFAFGMLNCGACTTEYVFARYLDPGDDFCGGRPATINAADFEPGAEIMGTDEDDVILGTPRIDRIFGGAGDDVICSRGSEDVVEGGPGNDLIMGGPGDDSLKGNSGADRLLGGLGEDLLQGGHGHDRLFGGPQDDVLLGDEPRGSTRRGRDLLDGGPGDDTLSGGPRRDRIFGRRGSDSMYGLDTVDPTLDSELSAPSLDRGDQMFGGPGEDDMYGGYGNDYLRGATGNDIVHGGPGDDVVLGNIGADSLHGGAGQDTCDPFLGVDVGDEECEFGVIDE